MLKKGLNFPLLQKSLRIKFFVTPRSIIQRVSVFFILNFEYLGENETKFENILTLWSVAQAGSNAEKKTWGRKSRQIVPLNNMGWIRIRMYSELGNFKAGSGISHFGSETLVIWEWEKRKQFYFACRGVGFKLYSNSAIDSFILDVEKSFFSLPPLIETERRLRENVHPRNVKLKTETYKMSTKKR